MYFQHTSQSVFPHTRACLLVFQSLDFTAVPLKGQPSHMVRESMSYIYIYVYLSTCPETPLPPLPYTLPHFLDTHLILENPRYFQIFHYLPILLVSQSLSSLFLQLITLRLHAFTRSFLLSHTLLVSHSSHCNFFVSRLVYFLNTRH